MSACTLFNEHDKGSNLKSIITLSVLGKQNVQEKKVYCIVVYDKKNPFRFAYFRHAFPVNKYPRNSPALT